MDHTMDETLQLKVWDEATRQELVFQLSAEDHARALRDPDFLLLLRNSYFEAFAAQDEEQEEAIDQDEPSTSSSAVFLWSQDAAFLLLAVYESHMKEFKDAKVKHKVIWQKIAAEVKKTSDKYSDITWVQCRSKLTTLKQMFKKIVDHHNVSGNDRKSWPYFDRMQEMFGASGWVEPKALASEAPPKDASTSSPGPGPAKRARSEVALEKFVEDQRKLKEERDRAKDAKRQELMARALEQKERQHKEKMEVMKKMAEALTGKKLFD